MLARRLTTILPAMILAEAIETMRIHHRPHRRPHGVGHDPPVSRSDHTISAVGLSGGGQVPLPGEVSKRARPACSC
jgi:magnesium chelatase family protein